MYKFLKLEIEKVKIKKYILIFLGFNIVFLVYGMFMYYAVQMAMDKNTIEQSYLFSYEGTLGICDATIRCMMMIIAAFFANKIIIDEYNKKTMDIIFLCPVNRKKIIRMKAFLIILLTFLGLLFGQLFTSIGSTSLAYVFDIIHVAPTSLELTEIFKRFLYNDVCYSLIGLIPIVFGMKRKLPRNTLLAAVVVTIISFFGFEQIIFSSLPFTLPITPAILAVFGILSLVISMKMAEKESTC